MEQGDLVEDVIASAAVGPSPKLEERFVPAGVVGHENKTKSAC